MPEIDSYRNPNDKARPATRDGMDRVERDRHEKIKKAFTYYLGTQKRHLDHKKGEPDDNVTMNLVKMTVDRTVSFLFPSFPGIMLDDDRTQVNPDEQWLSEAWRANGDIALLHKIALNGALSGHVYARVLPKRKHSIFPRVLPIDPLGISSFWRFDDIEEIVWHEMFWTLGRQQFIMDIINREDFWEIITYEKASAGGVWQVADTVQWNNPFGPIVHWQHLPNPNEFYGLSEAEDLALQDTINLVASEAARINRYYAAPRTVAIGVDVQDVQETSLDGLFAIPQLKTEADVFTLEMQGELRSSQALLELFQNNYLSEHRVVIVKGDVKDFQRVTNVGVRTVFFDTIAKNEILKTNYGRGIINVCQRLGFLGGRGDNLLPHLIYKDALPTDLTEQANVHAIRHNIGIQDRESMAEETGHDWGQVRNNLETEAEFFNRIGEAQGGNLAAGAQANG